MEGDIVWEGIGIISVSCISSSFARSQPMWQEKNKASRRGEILKLGSFTIQT